MVYGSRIAGFLFACCLMLLIGACSCGTNGAADCDPHSGSCTGQAGEYMVTLDINPKPVRHMTELSFAVTFSDDSPPCSSDTLLLDLSMPGMDMGKNRVELEKSMDSHYRGTGIIVRCASGKTLWRATLLLSDTLKPAFTFNVRE